MSELVSCVAINAKGDGIVVAMPIAKVGSLLELCRGKLKFTLLPHDGIESAPDFANVLRALASHIDRGNGVPRNWKEAIDNLETLAL
jgi:hypothetical protein